MTHPELQRAVAFWIPGKPVAKGRPRFVSTQGGKFKVYTPKETESYEGKVAYLAKQAMIEAGITIAPANVPVEVEIEATFAAPKSLWGKPGGRKERATLKALGDGMLGRTSKPDLDNIIKVICDALNGVAWHDDAQVVRVVAYKRIAWPADKYQEAVRIKWSCCLPEHGRRIGL